MPKIGRSEFIATKREQRIDLRALKADPAMLDKLKAAGIKLEDLERLDLANHDGLIEGDRELRALFYLLKQKERGPDAEALTVKGGGWSAAATPGDKAWAVFDSSFEASPRKTAPVPPVGPSGLERLSLQAAVGPAARNAPDDVRAVQKRLKDVGFDVAATGVFRPDTERALKTYRSMVLGTDFTREEPGLIEPNDLVHHALASAAPPKWLRMPAQGPGFINEDTDGYSFGSSESKKALMEIGAAYEKRHLATKPGAARLSLNDVSPVHGGPNKDHETHQNGLDLDFRLPRLDGTSGSDVRHANYDREATWAMLSSMAEHPNVERVLFSDAKLLARVKSENPAWAFKVFDGGPVHCNHIHIDVKPPVIVPQDK